MRSHLGRSVEELWIDFTSTLDSFSSQCIPVKTISNRKSLPLVTQAIRRQIRKRNRLYKQFKETGDQQIRNKFLAHTNSMKSKIKLSYETYLEGLLGLNEENSICDTKKLPLRKKMHCRKQFSRTASEYSANTLGILCDCSVIITLYG